MNQQPEQRVIYLCDVNRNVKCTKEGCVINGGPCCSTSEIDNSWRDINGDPIISTEEIQDWVLAEIVDPPIREGIDERIIEKKASIRARVLEEYGKYRNNLLTAIHDSDDAKIKYWKDMITSFTRGVSLADPYGKWIFKFTNIQEDSIP